MSPLNFLQPIQMSQLKGIAPFSREIVSAQQTLADDMQFLYALKDKTAKNDYDMYSGPDSYWNKTQNYPGQMSEKTGYEMVDMMKGKSYKQIFNALPVLGLSGVGLDTVGDSMISSLLNRFQLFDEFEVFMKRDPAALKKGYLVGHTPYEAERLQRIVPEKYSPAENKDELSARLQKESEVDPTTHLMATINMYRWKLPYVIDPALTPGINTIVESTLDLNWDTQGSYLTDNYEAPPLWQDEELPEHPWQTGEEKPSPWMTKHTPEHGFQSKSPFQMRMEADQETRQDDKGSMPYDWYNSATTMWQGMEDYMEDIPGMKSYIWMNQQ